MPNNDLISRGALVEDLSYCAPELFFDKDFLLHKIMRQPAIDAAPVVHGRWNPKVIHLNTPDYYACSVCGHEEDDEFTSAIPVPYVYKFCPNCGAKMDGGEDDGGQ